MAIQWFDTKKDLCSCVADVTQVSTVRRMRRGVAQRWKAHPGLSYVGIKASRQVRHWREVDDAHFWHWEDQQIYQVAISNTLR